MTVPKPPAPAINTWAALSASSLRCKDETRAYALKQSSLRALRCGGRVPRKISNARFRDSISKLRKGLGL